MFLELRRRVLSTKQRWAAKLSAAASSALGSDTAIVTNGKATLGSTFNKDEKNDLLSVLLIQDNCFN